MFGVDVVCAWPHQRIVVAFASSFRDIKVLAQKVKRETVLCDFGRALSLYWGCQPVLRT